MKKLITIVALAATVISAPAFAKSSANATATYNRQTQNQDWGLDHAKGPIGY
jgi:peptidoglycan hydrolase CwlO-like protein